jgi:hypothetical protein
VELYLDYLTICSNQYHGTSKNNIWGRRREAEVK